MADPLTIQALQIAQLRKPPATLGGASGASPESVRGLLADPDLDQNLYHQEPIAAPVAPVVPAGPSKKPYIPAGKSAEQQAADRMAAEITRQWGISFPKERFPGVELAKRRFAKEGLTF